MLSIKQRQLRQAAIDMPTLASLRSSTLEADYVVANNYMCLQLSVRESEQMGLALAPASRRGPAMSHFANELAEVHRERETLGARMAQALSPGLSPASDGGFAPIEPDLANLRRRTCQGIDHLGFVHHAGGPEGGKTFVGSIPKHLAFGPTVSFRAGVHSLRRGQIVLERIEVLSAGHDVQVLALNRKRRILARRDGPQTQGIEATSTLAIAMERRQILQFEGALALDYATGRPSRLILTKMYRGGSWQAPLDLNDPR
jgi:hypothetical protein